MAILNTGHTFVDEQQVTSDRLNNIANAATFTDGAVDGTTTQVSSGAIIVRDLGISTGKIATSAVTTAKLATDSVSTAKIIDSNVTKAKIENFTNLTVLGNVSGSAATPSEVVILDEDNMASDSATSLSTQQSIKAYVDTQIGSNNELSEVLANGNTTGANNIIVTAAQSITTDTVSETTADAGVTVDSLLIKDGGITAAGTSTFAGQTISDLGTVTTANIDGGSIDGTTVGATTPASVAATTITTTGNVGIGTTSPALKLDVVGNSAATVLNLMRLRNGGGSNGGGAALLFEDAGATAKITGLVAGANENAGLSLVFSTSTGSSGSVNEAMRLDAAGNVGIGTTSPSYKLDVSGEFRVNGGGSGSILVNDEDSSLCPTMTFLRNGGGTTTNDFIKFENSGGEVAAINSSGGGYFSEAVGIGTTAPSQKLEVVGGSIHVPGGSAVATNEAFGTDALASNTTGLRNVVIGVNALYANTSGQDQTAIGYSALRYNTTGHNNTACGRQSLYTNVTGGQNTATGTLALYTNTASNNTAHGCEALRYNTTGAGNTASGYQSLEDNTSASNNTASGAYALNKNTTGDNNAATGYEALRYNTTGGANTATGRTALRNNTTANHNTAHGYAALYLNTTGAYNVASGSLALYTNTTGAQNIATGYLALYENTTGSYNVATGREALRNNTTAHYNSAHGYQSLTSNTTGSRNTASGRGSLFTNTTGAYNTGIGYAAMYYNTTGSGNTGINPSNSSGTYAPVFDPTTENNRFCMGSTGVTNAYVQVAWTVVSDARDKTDFAPVPHGLDFVSQLKPTTYRYKMNREDTEGHGPLRYGFKAQEVLELEGADPVIVDAEDEDKLRFNDQSMIAVLVNALQELNDKFDAYVLTHP
mgnify:CR=1 FL=1